MATTDVTLACVDGLTWPTCPQERSGHTSSGAGKGRPQLPGAALQRSLGVCSQAGRPWGKGRVRVDEK